MLTRQQGVKALWTRVEVNPASSYYNNEFIWLLCINPKDSMVTDTYIVNKTICLLSVENLTKLLNMQQEI